MHDFVNQILDFIRVHPGWAALIIGVTAFGESFAFVSVFFPGTAILVAAGALAVTGAINPYAAMAAGAVGAIAGDGISFWIGEKFGPILPHHWPFRSRPDILKRGTEFFHRYGTASVFIGRFFGPIRAVIPLIAGLMDMPVGRFYIANVLSAVIWAPGLVLSGMLLGKLGGADIEGEIFIGAIVIGIAIPLIYWLQSRPWARAAIGSLNTKFHRILARWK